MSETQETPQKIDQAAHLEIGKEQKPNLKGFVLSMSPLAALGSALKGRRANSAT